jgi:hypothetical protein
MARSTTIVQRPCRCRGSATREMVSVGSTHTCALRADGTSPCWGGNGEGQLGRGFGGNNEPVPDTVPGLESVWLVRERASLFVCGWSCFGFVKCWGLNDTGQLGDGTTENSSTPIRVAIGGCVREFARHIWSRTGERTYVSARVA